MNKFHKRIKARQTAIKQWLLENRHGSLASAIDDMLNKLDNNELRNGFAVGFERGLACCLEHENIHALDFTWYFANRETGEALADGYDAIKTKGTLSKTDQGPDGLPGVEMKVEPGSVVQQYFAAVPTHIALNQFAASVYPTLEDAPNDLSVLGVELINLWNYDIAIAALNPLLVNSNFSPLQQRGLWITFTQHERWPVPIGRFV